MIVLSIPCLFDNFAHVIVCEATRVCAVVDPSEYYPVWRVVSEQQLDLQAIFCTHHHRDHIDGIDQLREDFPLAGIFGHASDQDRIPGMDHPLHEGDQVRVGELLGKVFHTPGHTRGSCLYHFGHALFTGDTLFSGGCGRLFEGTAEEMHRSLSRIKELFAPETLIYPGHNYTRSNLEFAQTVEPGNTTLRQRLAQVKLAGADGGQWQPSDLAAEKATNPFLRCDQPELCQSVLRGHPAAEDTPVEVFRLLRQMKDNA